MVVVKITYKLFAECIIINMRFSSESNNSLCTSNQVSIGRTHSAMSLATASAPKADISIQLHEICPSMNIIQGTGLQTWYVLVTQMRHRALRDSFCSIPTDDTLDNRV